MLQSATSLEAFQGTFAFLAASIVSLKLFARYLPRYRLTQWHQKAGSLGGPGQDIQTLMDLAARGASQDVQIAAIRSLGEARNREAIPVLGALCQSGDSLLASEAANSLGAIGDPAALEYLETASEALEDELSDALDLSKLDRTKLSEPVSGSPAWQRILAPLAHNNYRVFDKYTPHDIRSRSEDEIVDMLIQMAVDTAEPVTVRYHAIKNLELFRHPSIPRALPDLLLDEHTTVRYATAEVLSVHGGEDSVMALVGSLEDPNRFVRSSAAMTLAVLGSDRAIAPLMKLQEDPDDVVRYSVDKALDSIGRKKRIASLLARRRKAS